MSGLISRDEVIRIADLARLDLSDTEVEQYQKDLNNLLSSGKKLQNVDVNDTKKTSHAVSMVHELRKDEVEASLPQEVVLSAGSKVMDGFFQVPRIVEEQE